MTIALTLTLDDDTLTRVRAAATRVGLSPESWAASVIADAMARQGVSEDGAPFDAAARDDVLLDTRTPQAIAYQNAASLAALEDYDRTGEHVTFEDWAAEFTADVEARLAAR